MLVDALTRPSSSNSSAAATPVQFTPIVMKVLSSPRWFTGTDGRIHVVYELQLTNGFPVPATVKKVAVRDAATGTEVTTLSGERLRAAMSLQSLPTTPTVELQPSTVGMLWLDVEFDSSAKIPRRLDHSLTVTVPPGLPVSETTTYTGAPGDVVSTPPTVIGPPLSGTGWMAVGSCCDGPHRRAAQPINNALWLAQRFAIDFNKINPNGLLASGDPGRNENWYTYDQPVLAVADAEVVAVENTLPDQIPDKPSPVTIDDADGNYVILKLADGGYAFYAHLKPGSVTVKGGEQVRTSQVIAHTGNSGSSTGTHLHFQLMDQPSALVADGLPFEFHSFTLAGRGPALAELIALNSATQSVPLDTAVTGPRTDQLPLGRDVVDFASPPEGR